MKPGGIGNRIRDDRDEARDVSICLLQRHAGLQAGDAAIAEVGRVQFRPVEAERKDELRVAIEEAEPAGGAPPIISRGLPSTTTDLPMTA